MKKTILIAVMAMITLASFGQKKDTAKTKSALTISGGNLNLHIDSSKAFAFVNTGGDTLIIERAKAITVDGMTIEFSQLKEILTDIKAGRLPLMVDLNWIAGIRELIRTSINGVFKVGDIENLQGPLLPYVQYLQQLQQRQGKP